MRKILQGTASVLLIVGALYVFDWENLWQVLEDMSIATFIFATLLLIAEIPLLGWRWYLIVRPAMPGPFLGHLKIYMRAALVNTVSPAQLGGDVYRFFKIRGEETGGGHAVGLLLQERLIGLIGHLLFYVLCLIWLFLIGEEFWRTGEAGLFFAVGLVCVLILAGIGGTIWAAPWVEQLSLVNSWSPLRHTVSALRHAFSFRDLRTFLLVLWPTLVAIAVWIIVIDIVSRDAGISLSFAVLGLIGILTELIRLIPFTVQGIGVREGVFAFLFAAVGFGHEAGWVIGMIAYVALGLSMVLAGVLGWLMPAVKGMDRVQI